MERSDPKAYSNLEAQHLAQECAEEKLQWQDERQQLQKQIERYRGDNVQFVASIRHIGEEV
jgi:hypothetical protein